MKRVNCLLIASFLSGCFFSDQKYVTGLEGKKIPSFSLLSIDSVTSVNTGTIPPGKSFLVLCFQPYCTHCQAETEEILKNISKLGDTHIYMVTPFPFKDLKTFYTHYHLEKYPTITVAADTAKDVLTYFNVSMVPYIAVYNAQKCLKQVVVGEKNVDDLVNLISN